MFTMHNPVRYVDPSGLIAQFPGLGLSASLGLGPYKGFGTTIIGGSFSKFPFGPGSGNNSDSAPAPPPFIPPLFPLPDFPGFPSDQDILDALQNALENLTNMITASIIGQIFGEVLGFPQLTQDLWRRILNWASDALSGGNNQPQAQDVDIDNLPPGWGMTEHNGHIHVRDDQGRIRIRIDPPDRNTPYRHVHFYDELGRPLDADGNVVDRRSIEAHIPFETAW